MINMKRTAQRVRMSSPIAVGIAVLLYLSLTACAGSSSKSGTFRTAQTAGSSSSPDTVVPATTSTKPASSSAASGSACALVTLNEVTTATGKPMTIRSDAGGICSFSGTADPSQLVYVQLYPNTQSMATPKQMESGSAHLSGLGDDAFFATAGIVFVQKGSRGFSITMPSLTVTGLDAPPAILTLATAALSRL